MRWQRRHLLHAVVAAMLLSMAAGYLCRPLSSSAAALQNATPAQRPPATGIPAQPTVSPADLQRALGRIDTATIVLIAVTAVLGALGLILALASIVAVIYGRDAIRDWAQEQARVTASKEIGAVLARIYLNLSYLEWIRVTRESKKLPMEKGLAVAIRLGEAALKNAERGNDEERITDARSNLAYYFAQERMPEKKEIALDYAAYGKKNFVKFQDRLNLLANDIYVRMRYTNDGDLKVFSPLKKEAEDLMNRFPGLKAEVEDYVNEMKERCPSLAGEAVD